MLLGPLLLAAVVCAKLPGVMDLGLVVGRPGEEEQGRSGGADLDGCCGLQGGE